MDWGSYIRTNENQALKQIYKNHRQPCMLWLQDTFKVNSEDAKEIFQASIITLYENIITGKKSSLDGSIRTYLYGIAKNKYREYYKEKNNNNEKLSGQKTSNRVGEKIILEARVHHVDAVLHSMGPSCKLLLQLYYYKHKSIEEIREKLNFSNNDAVINQKDKCLKRLQKLIHHHINLEDDIES